MCVQMFQRYVQTPTSSPEAAGARSALYNGVVSFSILLMIPLQVNQTVQHVFNPAATATASSAACYCAAVASFAVSAGARSLLLCFHLTFPSQLVHRSKFDVFSIYS